MLILTVAVTAGSYLMFGRPAISAASVSVESVNVKKDAIPADGITTTQTTIRLANKETNAPAAGVWTGLIVANPDLRSPGFTYNGWYSLEPGRAFYQTNENGEVVFQLASTVA
ncbi:MAG: hypothetical protein KJ620_11190, partial [Candidatus Edwardsbacteria bacterium]|nr:hypothetical protein [Candidatus Edwardsbacteria bacterium]